MGGARTFLSLGPGGLSLEWSNEDALEPDHLASSPTPALDAVLSEASRDVDALVNMAKPGTESTGAWIIHHPSRGGPSSGLREVMMALVAHGCVLGPSIGSIGCGMLAGDPFDGSRGKRPGQWGWRARAKRAKRLDRAAERRERERSRRAQGRHR